MSHADSAHWNDFFFHLMHLEECKIQGKCNSDTTLFKRKKKRKIKSKAFCKILTQTLLKGLFTKHHSGLQPSLKQLFINYINVEIKYSKSQICEEHKQTLNMSSRPIETYLTIMTSD